MGSSGFTRASPADVLVFAPHPDDEVIGCGGVIQQALDAGRKVSVVFSTSGDGYPRAAAALLGKSQRDLTPDDLARLGKTREREAVTAARVLGLGETDLVFLRLPDGAMEKLSPAGLARATSEFEAVLQDAGPSTVYVTDAADGHPDHRLTNALVSAAVVSSGLPVELLTFVVHSGGDADWPARGPLFESHAARGTTYPKGVPWPPPVRVPLTAPQVATKLEALKAHASQWAIDHEYLGRLVKSEEIFWRPSPAR